MVVPGDLYVIYNFTSLSGVDGTGQTVAIIGDSNIHIQDARNFRSLMRLPANDPQVILATGVDPGIQNNANNSDEGEAILDVEWSGAAAPNATIDLVIAPSVGNTFGGDTAATFVVNNNLAPILSESFGACELSLTTSGNNFYNSMWKQAAAQGITVFISSGDNGSAGCDSGSTAATGGLAVNGLASTPYDVAVGGTDFNDVANPANFWNTGTTSPALTSAFGYIPEAAWNDSCTNPVFYNVLTGLGGNAEAVCNNPKVVTYSQTVGNASLLVPLGGSGGPSNCTTPSGSPATCSGGYPKPVWQTGTGVPSDGKRDLPDVALFAGTGAISASFYYLCQPDATNPPSPCNFNQGTNIVGAGGTSVSTQVFAGIMALVLQNAKGVRQGNANSVFYALAGQQPAANCNSNGTLQSNCIFNDITLGTNAMPCTAGKPNCNVAVNGDATGVLSSSGAPAYNAGAGYDLATGLGSVNVANLVNATKVGNGPGWATTSNTADFTLSASAVTVSGNTGTLTVTVTPQKGFSSAVTLSCAALASGETCTFSPTSPATITATTQITVTIHGVGALAPPATRNPNWRAPGGLALLATLLAAFLFLSLRGRSLRWSAAFAVVALALAIGIAGCGGSSNSSGGGGTTLPAGSGVFVASGGAAPNTVTHSVGFTIP